MNNTFPFDDEQYFECELWLFKFWQVPIEIIRESSLEKAKQRNIKKFVRKIWRPFSTVKWFHVRKTEFAIERTQVVPQLFSDKIMKLICQN
jgi:hypothetical protein